MPGAGAVFSSDGSQTNSRTLVPSAAAARATSARPVSVASISAPACLRMKAASSGLSMKLIGTSTAPSRASANRKRREGMAELRARMATRVPLPMPRAARPAARRSHSVANSA